MADPEEIRKAIKALKGEGPPEPEDIEPSGNVAPPTRRVPEGGQVTSLTPRRFSGITGPTQRPLPSQPTGRLSGFRPGGLTSPFIGGGPGSTPAHLSEVAKRTS